MKEENWEVEIFGGDKRWILSAPHAIGKDALLAMLRQSAYGDGLHLTPL